MVWPPTSQSLASTRQTPRMNQGERRSGVVCLGLIVMRNLEFKNADEETAQQGLGSEREQRAGGNHLSQQAGGRQVAKAGAAPVPDRASRQREAADGQQDSDEHADLQREQCEALSQLGVGGVQAVVNREYFGEQGE